MCDQIIELSLRLNDWKGRADKAEARLRKLEAWKARQERTLTQEGWVKNADGDWIPRAAPSAEQSGELG